MITFSPIQKNIQKTLSKKMRMMDKEPPFEINEPSTKGGGDPQANYMFARSSFLRMTSLLTANKKPIVLMGGELVHRHPHILNNDMRYGLEVYGYKSGGIDEVNPNVRPMAGVKDVNVEYVGGGMTLGATRQTTISWTCWTWEELEKFKPFFLHHGRDVLVEFGWGFEGPDKPMLLNIINENGTINEDLIRGNEQKKLPPLQEALPAHILAQNGHYDAVLGTIMNFEFSVNETGGFDCTTKLTSKGVNTLGKMDSMEAVDGHIRDLPILQPVEEGALWWKSDNYLKGLAKNSGLNSYYSFRSYMGTLKGHLNLNAKKSKGSIAYILGDSNPYCTWGWFEDNVLSRFAGQVNNNSGTVVSEFRSIEMLFGEEEGSDNTEKPPVHIGNQSTRIKTSRDLMPVDYSPKGWFWVDPQSVPENESLEDVRINETNSQLIQGVGVSSGPGNSNHTGITDRNPKAKNALYIKENRQYKIGDFKLMFGPCFVQDENDYANGSFSGPFKYGDDHKWTHSFLGGFVKDGEHPDVKVSIDRKKAYRESQADSYFRVFTDDEKDYGILRNIYFGHEFLSECFSEGTIKEGIESVWSKFSNAYGGIYDIQIEFDDKEGRLMLKDKGFAQKRVSEVLKNTSKKPKDEKYDNEGVFVFPIWEKNSIVQNQNLQAKIPTAQQMAAMYGNSNTDATGDGLTRDMKDYSARQLNKVEKVFYDEEHKRLELLHELDGDMEQPFRKGYTFGNADANPDSQLKWHEGNGSTITTDVYEDNTGGIIEDGKPSLFIKNEKNDSFGKGINEYIETALEEEFKARLLRSTGLEDEDAIEEAGLGDEEVKIDGSGIIFDDTEILTTEQKMKMAADTFKKATTEVDSVAGLYVDDQKIPYVARHTDKGELLNYPKMKVEYVAVMKEALKGPKGLQGKIDPLVYIDLELEIDGTGGIFPGNSFHSSYLPKSYINKMCFQTLGASHKVDASGWSTTVRGTMRVAGDVKPKTSRIEPPPKIILDGTFSPEEREEIDDDPGLDIMEIPDVTDSYVGDTFEVEVGIAADTRPIKQPPIAPIPKDDDKDQKVFVLMKDDDIEEYNTGLTQIGHISEFDVSRGHPVLKTTTVDSIFKELDGNLYKPGTGGGTSAKGVPIDNAEQTWGEYINSFFKD
tara:strand:- start:624 stop:4049 length:3426 start_codon:yes stop_codon:yes gene_type:complete